MSCCEETSLRTDVFVFNCVCVCPRAGAQVRVCITLPRESEYLVNTLVVISMNKYKSFSFQYRC